MSNCNNLERIQARNHQQYMTVQCSANDPPIYSHSHNHGQYHAHAPVSHSHIGPRGHTGARGPAGHIGYRGHTGYRGATGMLGPTGVPGPMGNLGPTGMLGPAGVPGPMGSLGPTGPMGIGLFHLVVSDSVAVEGNHDRLRHVGTDITDATAYTQEAFEHSILTFTAPVNGTYTEIGLAPGPDAEFAHSIVFLEDTFYVKSGDQTYDATRWSNKAVVTTDAYSPTDVFSLVRTSISVTFAKNNVVVHLGANADTSHTLANARFLLTRTGTVVDNIMYCPMAYLTNTTNLVPTNSTSVSVSELITSDLTAGTAHVTTANVTTANIDALHVNSTDYRHVSLGVLVNAAMSGLSVGQHNAYPPVEVNYKLAHATFSVQGPTTTRSIRTRVMLNLVEDTSGNRPESFYGVLVDDQNAVQTRFVKQYTAGQGFADTFVFDHYDTLATGTTRTYTLYGSSSSNTLFVSGSVGAYAGFVAPISSLVVEDVGV